MELREELGTAPEVEIPEPEIIVPGGESRLYRSNVGQLWQSGWEQLGQFMGDELYENFAYPILLQMVAVPENVEKLYTPYGGGLAREFLSNVKDNIFYDLAQRGIEPIIGGKGAIPNFELELSLHTNPERLRWVEDLIFHGPTDLEDPSYIGPSPGFRKDENPWLGRFVKVLADWETEHGLVGVR